MPNWLNYLSLPAVVLLTAFDPSRTFLNTLLGLLVGFSVPLLLFILGRLGGGDVKLLAVLGAAMGYPVAIDLLLWTCVFGVLVAFITVVVAGRLKEFLFDILEMILITFQQRMGRTAMPVSGLSTPLAVAIFISVCWLTFFPDFSRLTAI